MWNNSFNELPPWFILRAYKCAIGDLLIVDAERVVANLISLLRLETDFINHTPWAWIDGEIAPLYSDQGRPGVATRFVIGLLLLKHIYGLSDEGVCERWIHDPYFRVPRTLAGTSAVLC